ncbi:SMC domain-containing protein [Nitritalea halalkaliphila LW7]|uniref:SMC domain-containing protein n=1 Tax=Nitritalea halalkaliphila LW7 TaxID=1189621 RepID=I5C0R5_9BACT|nr:SMC family ATPase [Nitritalea halalkaliphila]EIM75417.1 SMC domain-containing protein [Nitritalea halalkaliphila LW7]
MIPLRLEIDGLYSYKEKQELDFRALTAAGLFGIFGAVGSGKSSLLEAILLALYGSTERLADRGEKTSMLHVNKNTLTIAFEFLAGPENSRHYLARYQVKRETKDRQKIKPAEHTFYLRDEEDRDWLPLTEKAEDLLGMKKEHFKRTIIIPQGKFREFIDLTPGPRADMMKELFQLERFDLGGKTRKLIDELKIEKIQVETQLAPLEEVEEAKLTEQKEQLLNAKTEVKALAEQVVKAENAYKKMQEWRRLQDELEKSEAALKRLLEREPEMKARAARFSTQRMVQTELLPTFRQLEEAKKELSEQKKTLQQLEAESATENNRLQELQESKQLLDKKAAQQPEREAKVRDLELMLRIKVVEKAEEMAAQQVALLQPRQQEAQAQLQALEAQVTQEEDLLRAIPVPSLSRIGSLHSSLQEAERLQRQRITLQKACTEAESKVNQQKAAQNELLALLPDAYATWQDWLDSLEEAQEQLEQKQEELKLRNALQVHRHALTPGMPCPLCGAEEHPNPLPETEADEMWDRLQKTLQAGKAQLQKVLQQQQQAERLAQEIAFATSSWQEKKAELAQTEQEEQLLLQNWREMGLTDQEAARQYLERLNQEAETRNNLEHKLQQQRQQLAKARQDAETAAERRRQVDQELREQQLQRASLEAQLTDPTFLDTFRAQTPERIRDMVERVKRDIEEVSVKIQEAQHALEASQQRLAHLRGRTETLGHAHAQTSTKASDLQALLERKLAEQGLDAATFEELRREEIAIVEEEAVLKQFDEEKTHHLKQGQSLRESLGEHRASEQDVAQALEALEEKRQAKGALDTRMALLEEHIQQLSAAWTKKQELTVRYHALLKREGNLRLMEGLFKGSGFVKYVSTIYLEELCATANKRFHRLTRNALSLKIDADNTFWVIDYLNGGSERLLKTLSGGQAFQASLCLALALAEKVKALNQADKSFFFLDEGFGALDKASLHIVFETLKALLQENRVVGIISHVEELQQEISVYAQVKLDPEKGSQVSYSFG